MSKSQKNTAKPLVCAALVCEQVLHEADGTLSAIRIIDTIALGFVGPPPSPVPSMQVRFSMLVRLKAGKARGEHAFTLFLVTPEGKRLGDGSKFSAYFENEESGANFVVNVGLVTPPAGLYWLELYQQGDPVPIARTPFGINYEKGLKP